MKLCVLVLFVTILIINKVYIAEGGAQLIATYSDVIYSVTRKLYADPQRKDMIAFLIDLYTWNPEKSNIDTQNWKTTLANGQKATNALLASELLFERRDEVATQVKEIDRVIKFIWAYIESVEMDVFILDQNAYNRFYSTRFSDHDRETVENGIHAMGITKAVCVQNFNKRIWPRILESKGKYEKLSEQLFNILKERSNKIRKLPTDPAITAGNLINAQAEYKNNVKAILEDVERFTDELKKLIHVNIFGQSIESLTYQIDI